MAKDAVTMKDVARRAGVAVSTVSRALASPERISAETRDLILRTARELGYAAPPPKPAPRTNRGYVALLVPDITNPFYFDIIRGSQERLRNSGYTQILIDTEESATAERGFLEQLIEAGTGAVVVASRLPDEDLREVAARTPLVTLNRRIEGIPTVTMDTAAIVGQAVEHLASLGHTRICYVSGSERSATNRRRWESCQDAAERLDLEVTRIGPFNPKPDSGAAAADVLWHSGATAGIAFNDMLAIGMLQRFHERGIRVPDDISVVGCDDIFGSDFCSPPLTTISGPTRRVGRELTTLLLALLEGHELDQGTNIELPVHLKLRASTGPAPERR
ncbi:MAG TPA: LacI family DNA-binding transcriptional regulator [Propionibacteriaceae bacterium]|nr:LacI family DNA-binding transcriptional regulator [Propionibacteriaceae bacterium]